MKRRSDRSAGCTEIVSCLTAFLGMAGDQISTRIGLMRPGIRESNPFVQALMERGLWLPYDLAFSAATVALPVLLIRRFDRREKLIFLFPTLLTGVFRLICAAWNIAFVCV